MATLFFFILFFCSCVKPDKNGNITIVRFISGGRTVTGILNPKTIEIRDKDKTKEIFVVDIHGTTYSWKGEYLIEVRKAKHEK